MTMPGQCSGQCSTPARTDTPVTAARIAPCPHQPVHSHSRADLHLQHQLLDSMPTQHCSATTILALTALHTGSKQWLPIQWHFTPTASSGSMLFTLQRQTNNSLATRYNHHRAHRHRHCMGCQKYNLPPSRIMRVFTSTTPGRAARSPDVALPAALTLPARSPPEAPLTEAAPPAALTPLSLRRCSPGAPATTPHPDEFHLPHKSSFTHNSSRLPTHTSDSRGGSGVHHASPAGTTAALTAKAPSRSSSVTSLRRSRSRTTAAQGLVTKGPYRQTTTTCFKAVPVSQPPHISS